MNRTTKTLLTAVLMAGSLMGIAETVIAQTASTAVPFLLISPNSRNSAMGEAGVALADDVSAVFWNPAGLAFQKGQELSLSHSNWLPQFQQSDLFHEYANYKIHLPSIDGTVGAAFTYLNLGDFEWRDEANIKLGTFKSYEFAVTASYGARLDEDMGLGIGLRLIHSSLSNVQVAREQGAGKATAVAGDIGILYRPSKFTLPFSDIDIGGQFAIGAAFSNIGPSIHYIDAAQADPLPTTFRLGFSYDLVKQEYNKLTWSTDVTKLIIHRSGKTADDFFTALSKTRPTDWNSYTLGTGIEYWYSDFVALRFGFFHEDPNYGNRRFLTFGAGVRYDIYGFDFSYISTDIANERSPLADTLRFTLSVLWDRAKTPPDDGTRVPADDSRN